MGAVDMKSLQTLELIWGAIRNTAACSTSFFKLFPSFTFIAWVHLKVKRAWSQNGTFILAFLSLSSSSVCLLPGTFSFNSPQTNMINWLHGFKCMNTERMANIKMCVTGGGVVTDEKKRADVHLRLWCIISMDSGLSLLYFPLSKLTKAFVDYVITLL